MNHDFGINDICKYCGVPALVEHDAAMTDLCGEIIATLTLQRNRDAILNASGDSKIASVLFSMIDSFRIKYNKLEGKAPTIREHICQVCSANWDYQYSTGCPGCKDKHSHIA